MSQQSRDAFARRGGLYVPKDTPTEPPVGQDSASQLAAAMQKMLTQPVTLTVGLGTPEALLLLLCVQMAVPQPQVPPGMREKMTMIGRSLQEMLVQSHPELASVYEAGWHWQQPGGVDQPAIHVVEEGDQP